MNTLQEHTQKIKKLQKEIRQRRGSTPLSFVHGKGHSNTTRSKSYNRDTSSLICNTLNQVIKLDRGKQRICVEPRVTMEELVAATLPFGLLPSVIAEFKGITVGGAIMGGAAESSSHRQGIFHDHCTEVHIFNGKGEIVRASPQENVDLFYGLSGSYGSFGLLVSAEIQLIPVKNAVLLTYHTFSNAQDALQQMQDMVETCDFLDGILFSKEHAVIISGRFVDATAVSALSQASWFAQKVKDNRAETLMPLFDYLFRYDQGAFWMGAFLFSLPFLTRFIGQGVLNIWPNKGRFTPKEVEQFKHLPFPGKFFTTLARPFMNSQCLWGLLHKAEKWIQERLIIQDFCIPSPQAAHFLDQILNDPGTFPIWLCPIKGTYQPQFLAPHFGHPSFINFGIYGSPSHAAPMQLMMKKLEHITQNLGGRKVLYSRSYYNEDTFWKIYSKKDYEHLRKKMHAAGVWRHLTEKVLSE